MKEVMVIEVGMGVDLQGQDATKAATRAVRDAIGRVYLPGMRRICEVQGRRMGVHVRLGVPESVEMPDLEAVKSCLPHGEVTAEAGPGGLLVPDGLSAEGRICVVNAAIEVSLLE